jgi:2-oxoglutarate dehydrogenase E2 component (dihydrolipoamide succinyltransferase)
MATEIRVPTLGESVSEATIGRWFKKPGDPVKADEPVVELETDKVTLEVNAPAGGTLGDILAKDGETVAPGAVPRRPGRRLLPPRRRRRRSPPPRGPLLPPPPCGRTAPPSGGSPPRAASIRRRSEAPARTGASRRATCCR